MAVDSTVLANYERDWNEALEQYDASLRAERMANVNYDPASRTFAASQPEGSAERLQREIFSPIQAKYGPLLGRGAGQAIAPQKPPRFFQTSAGVFSVDPMTGRSQKIIDVPRRTSGTTASAPKMSPQDAATYDILKRQFAQMNADLITTAKPPPSLIRDRDAMARAMTELESKYATQPETPVESAAPAQQWQVDPMSIPFGDPGNPDIFMGNPANPVIQDEPPAPLRSDPFAASGGPSVQRGLRILSIKQRGS